MKLTEKEVTGEIAKRMREALAMTQTAFWEPLGVKQSVGCRYEIDTKIPRSVRILLVARYVAGLTLDTKTPGAVEELSKLGAYQSNSKLASHETAAARQQLDQAGQHIEQAKAKLAQA